MTTQPETVGAPDRAPVFHRLTVGGVRRLTDDAVEVSFDVPANLHDAYRFAAGQHLSLRLLRDGQELRRTYSITTAAGDAPLSVGVRRAPHGVVSTWINDSLQPGDVLDVMTPTGRFTHPVNAQQARHWLFVAAGSGITPIMSLLRTALAGEHRSFATLVYCNRTVGSIMYRTDLDDLKARHPDRLRVLHLLTRERRGIDLFDGRLDAQRLRSLATSTLDATSVDVAFVCGPEAMSLELRTTLTELGIDPSAIHVELFGTDIRPRSAERAVEGHGAATTATIRLRGVETTIPVDAGERVLDAALRHGLDAPYSCRAGVCSTCRAHCADGHAVMDTNHALVEREVASGYVLTCQTRLTSPAATIDYDRP